ISPSSRTCNRKWIGPCFILPTPPMKSRCSWPATVRSSGKWTKPHRSFTNLSLEVYIIEKIGSSTLLKGYRMPRYAPPTRPRIVCLCSQKGGTGKTTSAINLAGSLVLREKKVLIIDLDAQANASIGLDIIISPEAFGTRLLLQDDRYSIADCVYAKGSHLDVIPSHRTLIDIQQQLLLEPAGRMRLKNKLLEGGRNYDFIFLDTPPDVGPLTQSALIAATDVVVPIDLGYFSLDGLENMLDIIEQVRSVYNSNLNLFGIILTKYDS